MRLPEEEWYISRFWEMGEGQKEGGWEGGREGGGGRKGGESLG